MKKARCQTCGLCWQISVQQEIPKSGYECPYCAVRRKKASQGRQSRRSSKQKSLALL